MKQFLKKIDFCCSIVGLNYEGHRRYKSPVGGVLSIGIFCAFIGISCYYLVNFFDRSTGKMTFENLKFWNPPQYNISENFTIALMMKFEGQNLFREDLVKIEANYITDNHSKISNHPVEIIPCSKNNFKEAGELFDLLELSKAMCFNLNDKIIQGSSVNDLFQYIQFRFLLCLKGTHCFSESDEERKKIFEELKPITYLYFMDTVYQGNSKNNKIVKFMNYIDVNVTYSNAKVTNIYFSNNEMQIDDSYFFPTTPKRYLNYMIDTFRDLVSVRTDKQEEALLINIMSSKNKQIIHITYMQLSELLANIAALINIIIFGLTGIGEYINNFFFQNDLLGALYFLREDDKKLSLNMRRISNKKVGTVAMKKSPKRILIKKKNPNPESCPSESLENFEMLTVDFFSQIKPVKRSKVPKGSHMNFNQKMYIGENNEVQNEPCSPVETCKSQRELLTQIALVEKLFSVSEIIWISFRSIMPCLGYCKSTKGTYYKYRVVLEHILIFQDLIRVYQKLQEIDMIKFLILNEKQLNLYKVIPKPLLTISKECENNGKSFTTCVNQKSFHYLKSFNEINDIFKKSTFTKESLFELFQQKEKSDIDQKLLSIFKERFLT